jgi:hypothetical protein
VTTWHSADRRHERPYRRSDTSRSISNRRHHTAAAHERPTPHVLYADQLRAQHELAGQLQTALGSRDVIGQAKGILMIRHGTDAETAFQQLRIWSPDANLELRDVARKVVTAEDGHE